MMKDVQVVSKDGVTFIVRAFGTTEPELDRSVAHRKLWIATHTAAEVESHPVMGPGSHRVALLAQAVTPVKRRPQLRLIRGGKWKDIWVPQLKVDDTGKGV